MHDDMQTRLRGFHGHSRAVPVAGADLGRARRTGQLQPRAGAREIAQLRSLKSFAISEIGTNILPRRDFVFAGADPEFMRQRRRNKEHRKEGGA